jgi:hypothetical protein
MLYDSRAIYLDFCQIFPGTWQTLFSLSYGLSAVHFFGPLVLPNRVVIMVNDSNIWAEYQDGKETNVADNLHRF